MKQEADTEIDRHPRQIEQRDRTDSGEKRAHRVEIADRLRAVTSAAELAAALGACRRAFVAIALFSGMSNILMLAGAMFMLEIYDRVLPSRSVPTLVALLILVGGL